ncbi:MAG: DUF1643 domain-containing protein [Cyanobacteriota bacterium]
MVNRSSTPNRLSLPESFPVPEAWQAHHGGAAHFSPCGRYRWWLLRPWCPDRSAIVFLGLNPSTANGNRDDPTLRRLRGLAARWGHGRLLVLNLFSRVGSDPAQLRRCPQPVGEHTDAWLATALGWLQAQPQHAPGPPPRVWVGWGHQGGLHGRHRVMLDVLRCWGGEVVCVGVTREGYPRHPLYCRASQPPLPFVVSPPPCPAFHAATPST